LNTTNLPLSGPKVFPPFLNPKPSQKIVPGNLHPLLSLENPWKFPQKVPNVLLATFLKKKSFKNPCLIKGPFKGKRRLIIFGVNELHQTREKKVNSSP